jgi:ribosomal protein S18 acetylase RimI-like enzyme
VQISVRPVLAGADLTATRDLLAEYLSQQVDNYPDPQAVDRAHRRELATLPGKYAPPRGGLFLGLAGIAPAGCVALSEQSTAIAEMKRLYVRDQYRGLGLGRTLARATIEAAHNGNYAALRLDVHVSRLPAIALYESLGFQRVKPWVETTFDLLFMELHLAPSGRHQLAHSSGYFRFW